MEASNDMGVIVLRLRKDEAKKLSTTLRRYIRGDHIQDMLSDTRFHGTMINLLDISSDEDDGSFDD